MSDNKASQPYSMKCKDSKIKINNITTLIVNKFVAIDIPNTIEIMTNYQFQCKGCGIGTDDYMALHKCMYARSDCPLSVKDCQICEVSRHHWS